MSKSRNTNHLQELGRFNRPQILGLWRELLKNDPPIEMRKDLMLRIVAQRMQEQEFGGLPLAACAS
jgi:hypothetical protein